MCGLIKDHVSAHNFKSEILTIANWLVLSVKSFQLKYQQAKEEQRKEEALAKDTSQIEISHDQIKEKKKWNIDQLKWIKNYRII